MGPLGVPASLVAQLVKGLPAMQEIGFDPWVREIPWRRKWPPTPELLPGELSHGQRSLEGYSPWGRKQLDRIKQLSLHFRFRLSHEGGLLIMGLVSARIINRDRE